MSTAFLASAILAFGSAGAGAQMGPVPGQNSVCLASIPDTALRRVGVYIKSDAEDSARALLKPADLLTEMAAERVRKILGAKPGELPQGEPTLTRRDLFGEIIVTLRRDGSFSSRPAGVQTTNVSDEGSRLLNMAVLEASNDGERVFWPESAKGDSANIRIGYWAVYPNPDGSRPHVPVRFASAVFSMALPWEEPAREISMPRLDYPSDSRSNGVEGSLVLEFVVDENGVLDPSTLRDVWPSTLPPLNGLLEDYYNQFLKAAKAAILKARFKPAVIAGCPVKQKVQQPFEFNINR